MKQIKIFVLSVPVAAKRLFHPLIKNVQNLVPEIQLFSASHLPFRRTFLPSNVFQKELSKLSRMCWSCISSNLSKLLRGDGDGCFWLELRLFIIQVLLNLQ